MADDTTKRSPDETPRVSRPTENDRKEYVERISQMARLLAVPIPPKESDTVNEFKSDGQSLIEYALLAVLVGVVVIAILTLLGPAIGNVFSSIVEAL